MSNIIKNKGNWTYEVDLGKIIESQKDSISFLLDSDRNIYYEEFLNESQAIAWRRS